MSILFALFGYLLGSVLFGDIISRIKGVDIRNIGSGNVGATNVRRALGKKYGFLVFILDMFKGFIPVFLARNFNFSSWDMFLIAIAPVLGHIFPIFYKFKGGKGVATSFGVVLAINPLVAFFCLTIWLFILYTSKYVSLASMIAVVSSIPVFLLFRYDLPYIVLALCVSLLIIFAHRSNISRLMSGTEHKIGN